MIGVLVLIIVSFYNVGFIVLKNACPSMGKSLVPYGVQNVGVSGQLN